MNLHRGVGIAVSAAAMTAHIIYYIYIHIYTSHRNSGVDKKEHNKVNRHHECTLAGSRKPSKNFSSSTMRTVNS